MKNFIKFYIKAKKKVIKIAVYFKKYPFLGKFLTETYLLVDTISSKWLNVLISNPTKNAIVKGLLTSSICTVIVVSLIKWGFEKAQIFEVTQIFWNYISEEIYKFSYPKPEQEQFINSSINSSTSKIEADRAFLKSSVDEIVKEISVEKEEKHPAVQNSDIKKNNFSKTLYLIIGIFFTIEILAEVFNILKDI